jgi:hypothetical protein
MILCRSALRAFLLFLTVSVPMVMIQAQTNCDEGAGPLRTDQPKSMTVQQVIDKFAAREGVFKDARNQYNYTEDISVQELDGSTVTGEFRLVQDVLYDDKGNRIENVKFAPQPSLRQISLSPQDYEDFRNKMPFVLTTEDIPKYSLLYVGEQKVDELDTYVFDIAPKTIEKNQRYFQGRVWVDGKDLQVVKTCGKSVPDTRADSRKKKNVQENITPKFVTYREQIDGEYWFPTYTSSDDILHFSTNDVHIREIIKYTNYKRFGSKVRIIYKGEAKDDSVPPASTPTRKP